MYEAFTHWAIGSALSKHCTAESSHQPTPAADNVITDTGPRPVYSRARQNGPNARAPGRILDRHIQTVHKPGKSQPPNYRAFIGARSARADARLCTSSGIKLIVPLSFRANSYNYRARVSTVYIRDCSGGTCHISPRVLTMGIKALDDALIPMVRTR